MKRYPLRPLVDFTGAESNSELARILGVQRRSIFRYASSGLPREKAEEYADRVAAHPYELWHEMRDEDIAAVTAECEECGDSFVPTRKGHVYCTKRCRNRRSGREWMRRQYQNPEWAEKRRAARRRLYEESADYERARQRRYYKQSNEAARRRERYATDPEFRQRRIEITRRARARKRAERDDQPA